MAPNYPAPSDRLSRALRAVAALAAGVLTAGVLTGTPASAQVFSPPADEPDRFRGQVVSVESDAFILKTASGDMKIGFPASVGIIRLRQASFTEVDFGVYVGAVSRKLNKFSPIVRDSLSYLHEGFELHIVDEALRGIALGHRQWDLTPQSVISHGWVDDIEVRVLSIKYGPTEEEETDVEIARNKPVLRMSLGDRGLVKPGAQVFVGARRKGGDYAAEFVMVGDGLTPPL